MKRILRNSIARKSATRQYSSHASSANFNTIAPNKLKELYERMSKLDYKNLPYAKRILYSHIKEESSDPKFLFLQPDRVAMQDISAQMAILQFELSGLSTSAVPTTIHCDHLIVGKSGAKEDNARALVESEEVFTFLQTAAQRYGLGFWRPGSGIIHQIVLENHAFPGGLMIGTDSHTPNAGGLGMIAVGVGGADAVDAMSGFSWELGAPKILGVHLRGKLSGWASAKDVILYLAGKLTVKGGTGFILEYFGEGVESLSCTGMATICNMGAELGATTSVFPFTPKMGNYLVATRRAEIAQLANEYRHVLTNTKLAEKHYDQVIEIDLSSLEPQVNGPFSPDVAHSISALKRDAIQHEYPLPVSAALIGSCTNSSYEDLTRAADLCRQALQQGLKPKCQLFISPGSEQVRATIERDGIEQVFKQAGAVILSNACGPCIGQWDRSPNAAGAPNSIVTSFNRNFSGRNDGNMKTHTFLASPDMVVAMAFGGSLAFNPTKDAVPGSNEFKFEAPRDYLELPSAGFSHVMATEEAERRYYLRPIESQEERSKVAVVINKESTRLQALQPFAAWNGKDYAECPILIKVQGKCTTDHISPAGKWLSLRGHLDRVSQNTLITALNAENKQTNLVVNHLYHGAAGEATAGVNHGGGEEAASSSTVPREAKVPDMARIYQSHYKRPWVIIADENYGEGSARESAAMQPRYLGGVAVIARSFARIHQTNLIKQGMLPITFGNPQDYDLVDSSDLITVHVTEAIEKNDNKIRLTVNKKNGTRLDLVGKHILNQMHWKWFKAGSALNYIRNSVLTGQK